MYKDRLGFQCRDEADDLRDTLKQRDAEWIRSIGKFRQALHDAGLHGHYNLLQEWQWPTAK